MKKIAISLILLGVGSAVFARPIERSNGFYAGLSGGTSYTYDTHANGFSYSKFTHFGNTVIGTAGYQFNQFFAAETDFAYYHPTVDTPISRIYEPAAVLKGIIPMMDGFSLYGKLGVAQDMYRYNNNTDHYNKTRPLLGLGAAYSITQVFELTFLAQSSIGHYNNDDNDPTQRGWSGLSFVGAGLNVYF